MTARSISSFFVIMLMALGLSGQSLGDSKISVALLTEDAADQKDPEYLALVGFLQSVGYIEVTTPTFQHTIKGRGNWKEADVIWIFKNDTLPFLTKDFNKLKKTLNSYVEAGGRLVLANQAAGLLSLLCLEPHAPETRLKSSVDEGYGRQLGYHAFRSHPLFDGMHGGAYVLKPMKDTSVWQTGYFGNHIPSGKTIAVDWDYIFLREESRLILEYEMGKGKVLAIGAYLLFDLPNRNRLHLEKFTQNIIKYAAGKPGTNRAFYWNFRQGKAIEQPQTESESQIDRSQEPGTWNYETMEPWNSGTLKPSIFPGRSSGNYWDLAGERMLVMGTDHGGITEIWAHPVLCLRDYQVRFRMNDSENEMHELKDQKPEIFIYPAIYQRNYSLAGKDTDLTETICVSPSEPVALIDYHYTGQEPVDLEISFKMLLRLMWPYSEKVMGNLYYEWDEMLSAFIVRDESGDFVTIAGIRVNRDGVPVSGLDKIDSLAGTPSLSALIALTVSKPSDFQIILASSSEGFDKAVSYYRKARQNPGMVFTEASLHAQKLLEQSLSFMTPDSNFNEAYRWALLATDRFMVNTPGTGTSLTAGYATSDNGWNGEHAVSGRPGYGWYFGRDGAWSAFALLHYGDFENVKKILETFQQYQDLNGKIFHELSTSGIVHYDAADATPLYVILAGRYLRHSGDTAFLRESWPFISKAIDYCYSTDTDGDYLIENTNVGHGWVEGGHLFGAHTSLHLASCWAEALREAAYIAGHLGMDEEKEIFRSRSRRIADIINTDFWNEQNEYYYHGLLADGSFMESISIMPVIPMLFGQADPGKAQKVLPAIAANAFTADWGCRIVPENDPHFNPRGYHTGSVWPLFTGWASLAEFKNHNYLQGYAHLSSNHKIWKYWGLGFTEEVLNGEIFQPSGVCHHQCWSETMSLQPAIEGMLGFQPDAVGKSLLLSPWFPADWDSASVQGIRIGNERIDMKVQSSKGKGQSGVDQVQSHNNDFVHNYITSYQFSKGTDSRIDVRLKPLLPPGCHIEKILVDGQQLRSWALNETPQGWMIPEFGFNLDSTALVEIYWHGGITALPLVSAPQPGERSNGFRIIDTQYNDGTYTVLLQAPRVSRQEFRVWAAEPGAVTAEGAVITGISGNLITLRADFADVESDHAVLKVIFQH